LTITLQAIKWLYDREFKQVFTNIGKDLWEDLRQEIALIVLEYDREKMLEIESKGKQVFKFWIVRTCCNQLHSKYGKMWRLYNQLLPVEDITKYIVEELEVDDSERTIAIIKHKIKDLYWYDKEILRMYVQLGSVRKVSAQTGIPHTSIFITIKNIRKCIKKCI
jgi:hypothetical protein